MRFHKKPVVLSIICCVLILVYSIPVFAEDAEKDVQTHYTLNDAGFEVYIYPGVSWDEVRDNDNYTEYAMYTNGEGDSLGFLIEWSEAEFEAGMESGAEAFTVGGTCSPDVDYWSQYDRERWQAGIINVDRTDVELQVRVRPQTYVAVYQNTEQPITRKVRSCTPFDEAGFYDSSNLKTDSPFDSEICRFNIEWSEAEYLAGIESGAQVFIMHGKYTGCEDAEMQQLLDAGMIRAGGEEELMIEVESEPASPRVYYDPYVWTEDLHTSVSRDTPLDELNLPSSNDLELKGAEYDYADTRSFSIQWSEEDYKAGLASGAKTFRISGEYTSDGLDEVEKQWWDKGLIIIDGGNKVPVEAVITVVEEGEKIPCSISLKKDWDESVYPLFTFPNPGNVEEVICMSSLDGENWYEYDVTTYLQNNFADYQIPAVVYDDYDELISIPGDAPSYYKIVIKGGPYAGESAVIRRNPPYDLTDADDDISGDRGGGGQGEHDRPDQDDEAVPPVMPPAVTPPVAPPPILPPEIPVRPPAVLPALPTTVPPLKTPGLTLATDSAEQEAGDGTQVEETEADLLADAAAASHEVATDSSSGVKAENRADSRSILKNAEPSDSGKKRIPAYVGALAGTVALMTTGSLLALRRRR